MIVQAILVGLIAAWGSLDYAFAISMGKGVDAAVALAMPIAVISLGIENLVSAITPVCLKIADDGAAQGNDSKIMFTQWLMGAFATSYKFLLAFGAFYIGADKVQDLLDFIPQFILDGMGVAAGILPAMGFAMLMRMIINKKLIPFFFLGFVLASYANIPVLGVAIIAVIIAVEKFGFLEGKPQLAGNAEEVDDDDDF